MKVIYLLAGYMVVTLAVTCSFWFAISLLWYVASYKEVILSIPWLVFFVSWVIVMFAMYNTIEKDLEKAA
jgi:hypothetical protein